MSQMSEKEKHKAGYVNIIGNPNVGKSTLMNALVGEKMSIITSKPQTTRHRILGLLNDEHFQIVFSDSPGIIETPRYGMQSAMNKFAYSSFEDADVLLFVTDIYEVYEGNEQILDLIKKTACPKILIINKLDLDKENNILPLLQKWVDLNIFDEHFCISAQNKTNTELVLEKIIELLPVSPPYYPKDELSDKSERFFVSEIIREKILQLYKKEVPYSCEVVVTRYKEEEKGGSPIFMIYADIYVERKSQKPILIGNKGEAIKKLGIASRKDIEEFLGQHVYLDLNVKIKDNWRDDEKALKYFGYEN